jgi:hypothetical protein
VLDTEINAVTPSLSTHPCQTFPAGLAPKPGDPPYRWHPIR